jgi:hypothetical protein
MNSWSRTWTNMLWWITVSGREGELGGVPLIQLLKVIWLIVVVVVVVIVHFTRRWESEGWKWRAIIMNRWTIFNVCGTMYIQELSTSIRPWVSEWIINSMYIQELSTSIRPWVSEWIINCFKKWIIHFSRIVIMRGVGAWTFLAFAPKSISLQIQKHACIISKENNYSHPCRACPVPLLSYLHWLQLMLCRPGPNISHVGEKMVTIYSWHWKRRILGKQFQIGQVGLKKKTHTHYTPVFLLPSIKYFAYGQKLFCFA